jgi:hypothetical protein
MKLTRELQKMYFPARTETRGQIGSRVMAVCLQSAKEFGFEIVI